MNTQHFPFVVVKKSITVGRLKNKGEGFYLL